MNGKVWQESQKKKSNSSSVKCVVRNQQFDSKQEYENYLDELILKEKLNTKNTR